MTDPNLERSTRSAEGVRLAVDHYHSKDSSWALSRNVAKSCTV
jgi:hypothetical protein